MKIIAETIETTVRQFGEHPESLGREFVKTFTYETSRPEEPYLTVTVLDRIEGLDVLGHRVEQSDLPRVQRAVEMAQESRDATRADMGYCGDFPIYQAPANFTWETIKTFVHHTDPSDPRGSRVGDERMDDQDGADRYFETVAEAEQAARQHMDELTASSLELATA